MRVLVLGAGGPAGVNTCRALTAAGHEVCADDENREHLIWAEDYADTSGEKIDWPGFNVIMPQPDRATLELASVFVVPATFLPKQQTIALCQDKFECGLAWRRAGLRDDYIQLIDGGAYLGSEPFPRWIRARHGAGGKAAICARSISEASLWVGFWHTRGLDMLSEEFLPGRDFSWCGIYYEGELLASFARERLEYLYPNLTPEGITGTPTRAAIVENDRVEEMAELAVVAVDTEPHGVFCVDLREDADGQPRPTEINAGRFSTTVGLWSIYSERSNFVALAAELAVGDKSRLDDWEDLPEGLVLSRHIDCGHQFSRVPVPA